MNSSRTQLLIVAMQGRLDGRFLLLALYMNTVT